MTKKRARGNERKPKSEKERHQERQIKQIDYTRRHTERKRKK